MKELKRLLEIKTREVKRLGDSEDRGRKVEGTGGNGLSANKGERTSGTGCDDADALESKLKQRIAQLVKQIAPKKRPDETTRSNKPQPRLLDALTHSDCRDP
ncbi:unnamed protein product [Haemonchus placei]|uniref:WH2 domain-containing protein n=1 Tax=Haemonchus placei TaxID=6290 RepID=A0A0N4VVS2_HAEPC|nr:unnamed protein product [Haemonchus placei]